MERDQIHEKFSSAILEMQQKSSLKYMILEKKISTMREELDVKDAQLYAAITSSSSDEVTKLKSVSRDVVREQGERIMRLEKQLMLIKQRKEWGDEHDDDEEEYSMSSSNHSHSD